METHSPQETVAALGRVWKSMADITQGLSPEQWATPTECPGWDVADQLVHIIGIERQIEGETPPSGDVSALDHVKNSIGEWNEQWILSRRPGGGDKAREEFMEVTQRRLQHLKAAKPEYFASLSWTPVGERPVADMLKIRLFDSFMHEMDIRRALGLELQPDPLGKEVSIERALLAIPGALGRSNVLKPGESLVVEVTGRPQSEHSWVNQDGRVVNAESAVGSRVALPAQVLLLRFSGRISTDVALESPGVEISGDASVVRGFFDAINVVP
jgi:uncharacterized protein (TIGR03083 family)